MHASMQSSVHACRRTGVASVAPLHSRRTSGAICDGGGAPVSLFCRTSEMPRLSSAWAVPASVARCNAARQVGQQSAESVSAMIHALACATACPVCPASMTDTLESSCKTSSSLTGGGAHAAASFWASASAKASASSMLQGMVTVRWVLEATLVRGFGCGSGRILP